MFSFTSLSFLSPSEFLGAGKPQAAPSSRPKAQLPPNSATPNLQREKRPSSSHNFFFPILVNPSPVYPLVALLFQPVVLFCSVLFCSLPCSLPLSFPISFAASLARLASLTCSLKVIVYRSVFVFAFCIMMMVTI